RARGRHREVLAGDGRVADGRDGVLREDLEGGVDLLRPVEVHGDRDAPEAGLVEGDVGGVDAPLGRGQVGRLGGVGRRRRGAGQREVAGGGGGAGLGGAGGVLAEEEE